MKLLFVLSVLSPALVARNASALSTACALDVNFVLNPVCNYVVAVAVGLGILGLTIELLPSHVAPNIVSDSPFKPRSSPAHVTVTPTS